MTLKVGDTLKFSMSHWGPAGMAETYPFGKRIDPHKVHAVIEVNGLHLRFARANPLIEPHVGYCRALEFVVEEESVIPAERCVSRQAGFYWVRTGGEWVISEWDGAAWRFTKTERHPIDEVGDQCKHG